MWARSGRGVSESCQSALPRVERMKPLVAASDDACPCGFTFAFPCVVCSFALVVLVVCFCSCPLLLYRLKDEIGYDFFALLYSLLGIFVFGVVVECLLVAWRRGCLGSCCPRKADDRRQDLEEGQGTFSNAAFGDGYGSLQEDLDLKEQPCGIHASSRTPPRGHDEKPSSPADQDKGGSLSDDADIVSMCDQLASAIEERIDEDAPERKKDLPAPLTRDTSFQGLPPNLNSFGAYLHLVDVQTPLSPKETLFETQNDTSRVDRPRCASVSSS